MTLTFFVQMSELGLIPTGPMSTKVPASTTTPPTRTIRSASTKVEGKPLQSRTISGPMPPLCSRARAILSAGSVSSTVMVRLAPKASAILRHDAVADLEGLALAVQHLAAQRHHLADVLMAADQRICQIPLMRRAGILLALAAEGVLVGAADTGKMHLHDHRAGLRIRHGEFV